MRLLVAPTTNLRRVIAAALLVDGTVRLIQGSGFHDAFVIIVLAALYAKTSNMNIKGEYREPGWGD